MEQNRTNSEILNSSVIFGVAVPFRRNFIEVFLFQILVHCPNVVKLFVFINQLIVNPSQLSIQKFQL